MRHVAALVAGLLFGLGLAISGMINPAKVLGLLDVTGDGDPSLALVMAAAIPMAALGLGVAKRRNAPVWAPRFSAPAKTAADRRLIGGAAIFGIGWGLVGYCPGPALASILVGSWKPLLFVIAMLSGMMAFRAYDNRAVVRGRTA